MLDLAVLARVLNPLDTRSVVLVHGHRHLLVGSTSTTSGVEFCIKAYVGASELRGRIRRARAVPSRKTSVPLLTEILQPMRWRRYSS